MWKFLAIGLAVTAAAFAQTSPSSIDFANLREDVRGLNQRVGELALRLEQLERENTELRTRVSGADRNYVTMLQLNQAIDELGRAVRADIAAAKTDTLQRVATQLEKLGQQTNAALESLAKAQAQGPRISPPAAVVASTATEPAAKEGAGTYTVQKGDTLAKISRKTGVREPEIISANHLTDPSKIVPGQVLVIPNASTSAAK